MHASLPSHQAFNRTIKVYSNQYNVVAMGISTTRSHDPDMMETSSVWSPQMYVILRFIRPSLRVPLFSVITKQVTIWTVLAINKYNHFIYVYSMYIAC